MCGQNEKERDTVQRAQADALLAMGRELQAADLYAHTAKAFEEVVLLLAGQDDALRAYLAAKLDVLPKSVRLLCLNHGDQVQLSVTM